jgi:hypothetical protein
MAAGTQGVGGCRAAREGVVARLLRGVESLFRLVECFQRDMGKTLVIERQGATIGGAECIDRLAVAAQEILADTEPDGGCRAAVGRLLQFADRTADVAMGGGVGGQ